jgi:hypothetical protein
MTSELCVDLIVCMIIFVICTDAIMEETLWGKRWGMKLIRNIDANLDG